MTMARAELQDAARRAFGVCGLAADADARWRMIAEMGWLMTAVPEAQGGLGLGREATGVIHVELGRALASGPAIAQMQVIEALCAADRLAGRDDLLARAMSGEKMTASLAGAGSLDCVPDADGASHILVLGGPGVMLVPLDRAEVTRRDTWDKSRRLFDVRLTGQPQGLTLAEGAAAAGLRERLEAQRLFALAGDSLGGAAAVLESTVDYLKIRHQFGRPLAMFQALKHRVADMKAALSAAEALYWARAGDPAPTLIDMGALKAHAATIYRTIAEEAVQLHGGIGLTMEHHCHLFLKRAALNAALGGDSDHWEERAGRKALAEDRGGVE